jgi:hypothetical protein
MGEFWDWWQHLPQHISPVIFEIGWFRLQYYGLISHQTRKAVRVLEKSG